ncbi:MAG: amidohydrolase family protein [Pseudomonadota bacterium]
MIIDAHSHWLPEDIIAHAHFFSKAWSDIEAQIMMMDEAGIDKALLSYPTSDAHIRLGGINEVARIYNDRVAEVLKKFPDRFIGAAVLPVGNHDAMVGEFKRATEQLGFKALSLASSYDGIYLDDTMFFPVYKEAGKRGTPVFVHSQIINPIGYERVQDPLLTPVIEYVFDVTMCIGKLLMSGTLREYPEVAFIFANFGGSIPLLAHRFDETYRMLRSINFVKDLEGNPTEFISKIYVDTGGDKTTASFLASLELFGAHHILWGSDWPAKKDITGAIQAVTNLNLPEQDKKNIMGGTLEHLLKGV